MNKEVVQISTWACNGSLIRFHLIVHLTFPCMELFLLIKTMRQTIVHCDLFVSFL